VTKVGAVYTEIAEQSQYIIENKAPAAEGVAAAGRMLREPRPLSPVLPTPTRSRWQDSRLSPPVDGHAETVEMIPLLE
jgi:hypothetical protein